MSADPDDLDRWRDAGRVLQQRWPDMFENLIVLAEHSIELLAKTEDERAEQAKEGDGR